MRQSTRQRQSWLLSRLTLFTAVMISSFAEAGKPGGSGGSGDPVPPGTIYYRADTDSRWEKMLGDGSNASVSIAGEPSYWLHVGKRWFLRSDLVVSANGAPLLDTDGTADYELFAFTEAGDRVQLTDHPGADVVAFARWGKFDTFVSFAVSSDYGATGAVYRAPVDWSLGLPTLGTSQAVLDIAAHDWSPNGDKVVYSRYRQDDATYELYVSGVDSSGAVTYTLSLGTGATPEWSPDGSRIAFQFNGEVWTIAPDGTSPLQLTKSTQLFTWQSEPTWSPDSKFLAYTETNYKQKGFDPPTYTDTIRRIPAGGGTSTTLTSSRESNQYPRWRP